MVLDDPLCGILQNSFGVGLVQVVENPVQHCAAGGACWTGNKAFHMIGQPRAARIIRNQMPASRSCCALLHGLLFCFACDTRYPKIPSPACPILSDCMPCLMATRGSVMPRVWITSCRSWTSSIHTTSAGSPQCNMWVLVDMPGYLLLPLLLLLLLLLSRWRCR